MFLDKLSSFTQDQIKNNKQELAQLLKEIEILLFESKKKIDKRGIWISFDVDKQDKEMFKPISLEQLESVKIENIQQKLKDFMRGYSQEAPVSRSA